MCWAGRQNRVRGPQTRLWCLCGASVCVGFGYFILFYFTLVSVVRLSVLVLYHVRPWPSGAKVQVCLVSAKGLKPVEEGQR